MTDVTRRFLDILTEEDIVVLMCFLNDERAILREIAKGTGKSVEEHFKDPDSLDKLLKEYRRARFLPTVGAVKAANEAFLKELGGKTDHE